MKLYSKGDYQIENKALFISRKMSVLRSMYDYFYKRGRITNNPMLIVDLSKTNKKNIIRLDTDEVVLLLDLIENGGIKITRKGGNESIVYFGRKS